MARAKKLWRPLKDWKRHEWAPMEEVWQRAEKVIGSDLRDMRRDLRQDFLDRRLIMGMRLFALDGTETRIILERECWQWLKINYAWSITGWEEIPGWKTEWEAEARKRKWEHSALVVRRRELDKHYPAATAATPIEHRADDSQPSQPSDPPANDQPTRRKPGPKPRKDWPKHVNREIVRALRAGKSIPTAADLAQSCEDNLGYQPDISAVQKHVGHLLNRLLG